MPNDPISVVIQYEGGFINHKKDRGGPTKFGITQNVYGQYLARDASLQEVRDMTEVTAREIYERLYLTNPRIHTLTEPTQTMILDSAINHGPKTAIRLLQAIVNAAGFGPVTVDGVLGPQTRECATAASEKMGGVFQNALVSERIRYIHEWVIRNPDKKLYLDGMIARAEKFKNK